MSSEEKKFFITTVKLLMLTVFILFSVDSITSLFVLPLRSNLIHLTYPCHFAPFRQTIARHYPYIILFTSLVHNVFITNKYTGRLAEVGINNVFFEQLKI